MRQGIRATSVASRAVGIWEITLAALCLSASISIAYFGIAKYDLSDPATADVDFYIAIHNGESLEEIVKPFRYRIVIPELARIVPSPPAALTEGSDITSEKITKFKFGVVNIVALVVAGLALVSLLRFFQFDSWTSLVGVLLFYLSFWVVLYGGIPLVEAGAYAALAVGCLAAARRWNITLAVTVLVGMFVKETTILVPVFALALRAPWRLKLYQVGLCLPGVIAYGVVRLVWLPTAAGYGYSVGGTIGAIPDLLRPRPLLEVIVTFGPLWVLAAAGWWEARRGRATVPGSLVWFIAAVVVMTLANASSFGRSLFLAFPAMLPFALLGLVRARERTTPGLGH
jgi:hypothetical protein